MKEIKETIMKPATRLFWLVVLSFYATTAATDVIVDCKSNALIFNGLHESICQGIFMK